MCRSVQALENQSAHAGYNIDDKILSPEVNLTFIALQCTMIQKLWESACERTWCHLYLDCNSTGQYQVSLTSSCACSTLLILASAVLLPAATSPVLQMSLSMPVCVSDWATALSIICFCFGLLVNPGYCLPPSYSAPLGYFLGVHVEFDPLRRLFSPSILISYSLILWLVLLYVVLTFNVKMGMAYLLEW